MSKAFQLQEAELSFLGSDFDSLTGPMPIAMAARGPSARAAVLAKLENGRYTLESSACLCGSSEPGTVLARIDRYRLPHRSVLCHQCGLVRTDPRMTAASYADFYANHYRAIYERPGQSAESLFAHQADNARRRFLFLRRHAKKTPESVIELGCGGGWNLLPFSGSGARVVGFDFDPEYLNAGRHRGLDLRPGGVDEASKLGIMYHAVILSHVVEHMLDPVKELQRVRTLLYPDGLLFAEVPSILKAGHPLLRYFQSAHTYSFAPESFRPLLEQAGFKLVAMNGSIASVWKPADVVSGSWSADKMLAPRVLRHLQSVQPPGLFRRLARGLRRLFPLKGMQ